VAEPAIDTEAGHVMLMAERHRLLHEPMTMANVIGAWPKPPPPHAAKHQSRRTNQPKLGGEVRRRREDRWHALPNSPVCRPAVMARTGTQLMPRLGVAAARDREKKKQADACLPVIPQAQ
jgi:hypothetical protein